MPVIILGGIMFGLATPTEISSFAVVYGIVLAGLVYRELGFRTFITGMIDCAAVSGMILFILAGVGAWVWASREQDSYYRTVAKRTDTREFLEHRPRQPTFEALKIGGIIAPVVGVLMIVMGAIKFFGG